MLNDINYPYWSSEFEKEFKGYEVLYREDSWSIDTIEYADSYRVFMIMCNNQSDRNRMDILNELKNSTEDNPIRIQNEIFWTIKI